MTATPAQASPVPVSEAQTEQVDAHSDVHDPGTVTRKDGSTGIAARGYSWPPFQPGHELSMQHGAYSPRRVDPLAHDIIEAVRPTVKWLTATDEPALLAWGRAEAKCLLLTAYLERAGEASDDGVGDLDLDRVNSAYRELHRAETRAANLRTQLGFTPLARTKLQQQVAATEVDLASLMAREHERRQIVDADATEGADDDQSDH